MLDTVSDDDFDAVDRDALQRCMSIAMRDARKRGQLVDMLQDRPWEDVAQTAAYYCQRRALKLRPWQSPPSVTLEDGDEDADAQALLRRLLDANLSKFEPDPLAALAAAGRKRKRK